MKFNTNITFASVPNELVFLLRDMGQQINQLSDAVPYLQQAASGSQNSIIRLLTASQTLDFPVIVSGGVAALPMTMAGAAAGDFVLVGPPSTLEASLSYVGFITAPDTIGIRLKNNSTASVDPAPALWSVLVLGISPGSA